MARAIRDRTKTALAIETEKGPLTQPMNAFQTALVHDLDADGFADVCAQTIACSPAGNHLLNSSLRGITTVIICRGGPLQKGRHFLSRVAGSNTRRNWRRLNRSDRRKRSGAVGSGGRGKLSIRPEWIIRQTKHGRCSRRTRFTYVAAVRDWNARSVNS